MNDLVLMGENSINGVVIKLYADIHNYSLILSNGKESICYEWTFDNILKLTKRYGLSPPIKKQSKKDGNKLADSNN